jgi:hypothetical protein
MKHLSYILALGAIFGASFAANAGQVPNPINADNTITTGHFLLGNGAQRAADSGWSLVPMANGGCNAALAATSNDLLYSTASACALLPTANSSILATNGAGAPAWTTTLPGGLTIPVGDLGLSATAPIAFTSGVISINLGNGLTVSGGNLIIANPSASTLGGIESITCAANNVLYQISTGGVPSCEQLGFSNLSGQATLAQLPSLSANTILGNGTAGSAVPTALSVPSCSASTNALQWTTSTGFACNSAINASTLGGATFAAPGAIGGTTPGSGKFSSLQNTGVTSCNAAYQAVQTDGSGNQNCGGINPPSHPGYISGNYYAPLFSYGTSTTATVTNTLYAEPFRVGGTTSVTFTKMAIYVATGVAATNCELGVYNNSAGVPGTRNLDAGNVATTTSSTFASITGLSITLTPGWYWLVVGCNGTPSLDSNNGSAIPGDIMGWTSTPNPILGYQVSWTYSTGNLPSSFGAVTVRTSNGFYIWLGL